MPTINQLLKSCRKIKKIKTKTKALLYNPQKRGICQKIYIMTPKKPNSASRKVAKIKLSTNQTIVGYIPGEKHSLQEYNFVLVRGGRTQDLPGVNYKIIRGALEMTGVIGRTHGRSKYGLKKIKDVKK